MPYCQPIRLAYKARTAAPAAMRAAAKLVATATALLGAGGEAAGEGEAVGAAAAGEGLGAAAFSVAAAVPLTVPFLAVTTVTVAVLGGATPGGSFMPCKHNNKLMLSYPRLLCTGSIRNSDGMCCILAVLDAALCPCIADGARNVLTAPCRVLFCVVQAEPSMQGTQ